MAKDNPILDMGLLNMMQPNKYINPKFANQALQLPGFYTGSAGDMPPTDAQGNPIQGFVDYNKSQQDDYQSQLAAYNASLMGPAQGTTLNNTGQGQSPVGSMIGMTPQYAPPTGGFGGQGSTITGYSPQFSSPSKLGTDTDQILAGASPEQLASPFGQATIAAAQAKGGLAGYGGAPAAAAGSPPKPPDLRQAYLNALSNPGKVTTPGANVAASSPLGKPSVLTAFLDAHPSGTGMNKGFYDTLNNVRSA